ncbi:hypothetical protein N7G274_009083 [Stereocaulon virgatum]|uniref:Uncharacterized protein n=1 Tax=Stereocaulon virgatum TaxID=373712 RepID=A0ABR3ZZL0_9LECA
MCYDPVMIPIYIFIVQVTLMQLSIPGPYQHESLQQPSIWTGLPVYTIYILLCLVAWKRVQASNGANVQLTIGGLGVHFMLVRFTLTAIILTSTITILGTPFVEQGLLYTFFSYSFFSYGFFSYSFFSYGFFSYGFFNYGFFSYRACLQSRLVGIPFMDTQYCEPERIHREQASHYLASLKYTNEESYQVSF